MKNLVLKIFVIILILSLPFNAVAQVSSAIDVEKFLSLGFTLEEINDFTEHDLEQYGHLDGELVQKTDIYQKMTRLESGEVIVKTADEETALKESKALEKEIEKIEKRILELKKEKREKKSKREEERIDSEISILTTEWRNQKDSGWLKLSGYVAKTDNGAYLFKVSYVWLNTPKIQLSDIIGIAHSEHWSIDQDSEYSKHQFDIYWNGSKDTYGGCYCTSYKRTSTKYVGSATKPGVNGMAIEFELTNGDWVNSRYETTKNYRGFITYTVTKAQDDILDSNIYGTYHHKQFTATSSIDIKSGGISVSPSWAYDAALPVNVKFTVN
jgi:DNA-binding transcriptional MerR regulator